MAKGTKYYGTGRRKTSIARVYVCSGKGKISVNGRDVKEITFEERRTLFDGISAVTLTVQRGAVSLEIAFSFDEPKI